MPERERDGRPRPATVDRALPRERTQLEALEAEAIH